MPAPTPPPAVPTEFFAWRQESIAFWALIVACISLAWQIIAVAAKAIQKPQLKMRVMDSLIEIMYSNSGPIFFLRLSLLSQVKNSFVDHIDATLVNKATKEQHTFIPRDFLQYMPSPLSPQISPKITTKEPFSPFGVTTDRYENVVMLFWDPDSRERIAGELAKGSPTINNFYSNNPDGITDDQVDEFNKSDLCQSIFEAVKSELYIKPGEYSVTVCAYVGTAVTEEVFDFAITIPEYEAMKSNAKSITHLVKKEEQPRPALSVFPRIHIRKPAPEIPIP